MYKTGPCDGEARDVGVEGDGHQVQGPRGARNAGSEESIILSLDR